MRWACVWPCAPVAHAVSTKPVGWDIQGYLHVHKYRCIYTYVFMWMLAYAHAALHRSTTNVHGHMVRRTLANLCQFSTSMLPHSSAHVDMPTRAEKTCGAAAVTALWLCIRAREGQRAYMTGVALHVRVHVTIRWHIWPHMWRKHDSATSSERKRRNHVRIELQFGLP